MPKNGGFLDRKMCHFNGKIIFLLIVLLIPAVLALHKGVRTVVVPTTPECLAGVAKNVKYLNKIVKSFRF